MPRFLILCGSLRERSSSRFLADEAARPPEAMGGGARIEAAHGLPLPDDTTADPAACARPVIARARSR
jgi:arsenic resistance protein ArsH